MMKNYVARKKREESKVYLNTFMSNSSKLIEDFKAFQSKKCVKSRTFNFWNRYVKMVCILRDLRRADREGDWDLHLHSVQAVLPLFAGCDRINSDGDLCFLGI